MKQAPTFRVLNPADDMEFNNPDDRLVMTARERRYVTKDQFGWPVYHKAGERTLLRITDFGKHYFPADAATSTWWKEHGGE
jgi:hypothetical protein